MGLFNFLKTAGSSLLKKKAAKYKSVDKSEVAAKERQEGLLEGYIEGAAIDINNVDIEIDGENVTVWGEAQTNMDREKTILMLGNIEGVCNVDDRISVLCPDEVSSSESTMSENNATSSVTMYEVKPGDSLSKIAKAYYGDPMKYKTIFEANYPVIKDPNLIYPGQKIRIPNEGMA